MKREIFNNKDFRIGLSYAIDRNAIIDSAYLGQGEPWQAAPRKESAYYNERLAKQYTNYDVAKANEYLDKAYPKKDDQGFRLGPDGKRISFSIMVIPALGDWLDATQLVAQYWQKVGIDAQVQTVDRTLFYDLRTRTSRTRQCIRAPAVRLKLCLTPPSTSLLERVPVRRAVGDWYASGGKSGEELLAEVKKQMDLYRELKASADPEKQRELFKRFSISPRINFMPLASALRATSMRWSRTTCRPAVRGLDVLDLSQPGRQATEQYYFSK